MTAYDWRSDTLKIAKMIKDLQDRVVALEASGARMPIIDNDPGTQYGNAWMLSDNRLRIRRPDGTVVQVSLTATGSTSSSTPLGAGSAQTKTRQGSWAATWSQTYQQSGGQRSESMLHVGYGDSYNGLQTVLIGLPTGSIVSALSGAVINKVEVYLFATSCYWASGSTVYFGTHTNSSAPGSLGGLNRVAVSSGHVNGSDQGGEPNEQRWKQVSTSFGAWLRDGTASGVCLTAPNDNASFYAVLGGVGSGIPGPSIRITYTK